MKNLRMKNEQRNKMEMYEKDESDTYSVRNKDK